VSSDLNHFLYQENNIPKFWKQTKVITREFIGIVAPHFIP
jgi:hypothetical protein